MYAWGGNRGDAVWRAWCACRSFLRGLLRPVPQGDGK
jgi:hypothetical protein